MKPLRQAKKATVSSTDETQGGDEVFFGSREAAKAGALPRMFFLPRMNTDFHG